MNLNELRAWISANFWKSDQIARWAENNFFRRASHKQAGGTTAAANLPAILDTNGKWDNSLINWTAATEDVQDLIGAWLSSSTSITITYNDAGNTLTFTRAALTGDVTASANSNATTIANDAVTDTKLRNSGALSVIGRSVNSSGDPADISATAASGAVLRESGSTLGFGTVATAGIANDAVDNTKLSNMAQATIKGRASGAGTGDPVDLSASQVATILSGNLKAEHITAASDTEATFGGSLSYIFNNGIRIGSGVTEVGGRLDVAQIIRALTASGIRLEDDGSNALITLLDGGGVDVRRPTTGNLMTFGTLTLTESGLTLPTGFLRGSSDASVVFFVVRSAAADSLMGAGVDGDTFARVFHRADGRIDWGPGNATRDTNLYRNGADELKTDDALVVTGTLKKLAGSSSNDAAVGGKLFTSIADNSNTSTSETDLTTYSIPANTLSANAQSIWFEATFSTANNGNAKTIRMYFGSTVITTVSGTLTNLKIKLVGRIRRSGAATQRADVTVFLDSGGPFYSYTTPTATLSGAVTIKATGQGGASSDVTQTSFNVGWDDANT